MTLDKQKLETALQAGRKDANLTFSLHLFDTVSSTNQILWNLLNQGAKPGCTVIATRQTAGRGQWGRQWISDDGGLYLSVALAPKLNVTNGYQLTLATAWGIAKKLEESGIPTQIKWPNDLVLNRRKLGGILTETKVQQGRIKQAIIGVGINWANPVPENGINLKTWQTLNDSQSIPTLEILAATVLIGIESGIQCLLAEGANILITRYLELLTNLGDRIHHNNIAGTVVGVTQEGALRVCMETCEFVTVQSREIYFQPGTISLGYDG
ncbi:biotin--[acetyl-CoA-carboxylase] ligase [Scytonema sp. UIC 10036]|uniref:biotin--[acetyl-CoA-carboxylase] ligase n=1 Tax=Scytonema sp. UIC 10036 TaxID=2304196 RepID=UPI0012DA0D96|nr:biotin--[acetyl-CoA-carboxylase] ligase [Scytonema sp. UIC 10036]MUG94747.1 biotin--[acetyl-CoA-carboxylase] ligase [Scytonema sp. UIC 10036]